MIEGQTQAIAFGATADRVMAALVSGLEYEFGRGAGAALAARFLEAEETEFLRDSRASERWLGSYRRHESALEIDAGDEDFDEDPVLDRVAICGRIDGRHFVATVIVDGDGNAHGMLGRRNFASASAARSAFAAQR